MSATRFAAVILLALPTLAAQTALPALRVEPTDGGSVLFVRNTSPAPLTAYLIELVDYPGSSFSFWQDETVAEPILPNGETRIQITNMTVGAVPDYVKIQAALYADGSSAGIPERVAQLLDRRRAILETVRQVRTRIEKAQSENTPKSELLAGLRQWADSLQPAGKGNRITPAAVNQAAARGTILATATRLDALSFAESVRVLRAWESALSATPPK